MWVTTKSIIKEIKQNQDELMKKMEDITFAQNESKVDIQNKIKSLTERIESAEALLLEIKAEQSDRQNILMSQLADINKLLTGINENIFSSSGDCINSINGEIERISNDRTIVMVDKLNTSVEKIIQSTTQSVDQSKKKILCDVGQVMEVEQNLLSMVKSLCSRHENIEKIINEAGNAIGQSVTEENNKLSIEIEHIRKKLDSISTSSEKRNETVVDNIETMNIAMQEVTRNLLSLDEGNRLIIARLLLRDLEV